MEFIYDLPHILMKDVHGAFIDDSELQHTFGSSTHGWIGDQVDDLHRRGVEMQFTSGDRDMRKLQSRQLKRRLNKEIKNGWFYCPWAISNYIVACAPRWSSLNNVIRSHRIVYNGMVKYFDLLIGDTIIDFKFTKKVRIDEEGVARATNDDVEQVNEYAAMLKKTDNHPVRSARICYASQGGDCMLEGIRVVEFVV